jgi:A/G-specific adenine glycosylase
MTTDHWGDAVIALAPLASWFEAGRRHLPWRAANLDSLHPDPYAVLVSELMLQQTQVATVIPYFERWLRAFPDAASLAGACEDSIHKHWEGLGYYRRARHLQAAARIISEQGWPADLQGLLDLPGLGPYSAAAVAAIAFQQPEPALDGNALRVTARLLALVEPRSLQPRIRAWLRPALAALGASRMVQGIMELGATVCLPRSPRCGACPLSGFCAAQAQGIIDSCPGTLKRSLPVAVEIWLVALSSQGCWLVERPARKGLLAGLWRWPALELPPPAALAAEDPLPFGIDAADLLRGWVQTYTHRREHVTPCRILLTTPVEAGPNQQWVSAEILAGLPMGRRDQRLRDLLPSPKEPASTVLPLARILAVIQSSPPRTPDP